MNRYNNPRLTNTTVSGTGVKHPMRPHVILGDPENGFIRGDLLDANAVIKLIKNAARAAGVLEELEKSDWINYNGASTESDEILADGEVGFINYEIQGDGVYKAIVQKTASGYNFIQSPLGVSTAVAIVGNDAAFGMKLSDADSLEYIHNLNIQPENVVAFSSVADLILQHKSPNETQTLDVQ